MTTREEEINGIALAGELLVFELIGLLKAKGLLSKEETAALYEQVLMKLESYPQNNPAIGIARKIVDQMAGIAAKTPNSPPNT